MRPCGKHSSNLLDQAICWIIATQDERRNMTWHGYDPNCGCSGQKTFITNALGQVSHRSYNRNGNEVSVRVGLG